MPVRKLISDSGVRRHPQSRSPKNKLIYTKTLFKHGDTKTRYLFVSLFFSSSHHHIITSSHQHNLSAVADHHIITSPQHLIVCPFSTVSLCLRVWIIQKKKQWLSGIQITEYLIFIFHRKIIFFFFKKISWAIEQICIISVLFSTKKN